MSRPLFFIVCIVCFLSFVSPAASQTVTRLTTNGYPKSAYNISGNGAVAVWIEKAGDIYSMKSINTEGSPVERTLFSTDANSNITGITGPYGGAVQVWHLSLRLSYDGTTAALHVFDRNGSKECFAIVNTTNGSIQVIPAGIPTGMGNQDVALLDPAAFDISDDGSVVLYTISANYLNGTEDASAIVANTPGGSPYRVAGYVAKADGVGPVLTYSSGPNHMGRPSIAGDTVVFAGNPNAQRELPNLSNLYSMPLGGGTASLIGSNLTDPNPINLGSVIFNIYGQAPQRIGNFYPAAGGNPTALSDNDGNSASFPFFDTSIGIAKVAVGAQIWDRIWVIRNGEEVEQIRSNDAQLPAGRHFGAQGCAGGASYETWEALPRNGGKILFTMCGENQQDLFVQNGLKTSLQEPTPTATPTATATPKSANSCSLNVGKACRKKVRPGTMCAFSSRLYKTADGEGIKNAKYNFQRK
ncbi:MAG: hypothetical protein GYA55_08385, partial [SAR324 cluster bacterium]|nr:hypothetical protein [SAR324 cluster bacterium]